MNWLLTNMQGWKGVFELYNGSHLLSTAILVSVVALVCHFIPLRPVVQHALWFVVVLRFVLPSDVAPSHVVSIPSWIIPLPGAAEAWLSDISEPFRVPMERGGDVPGLVAEEWSGTPPHSPARTVGGTLQNSHTAMTSARNFAPVDSLVFRWRTTIVPIASLAWFIGSCLIAARSLGSIVRFHRAVTQARPAMSALQAAANETAQELQLKPIPIIMLDGLESPCVWCFGRLRICWPSKFQESCPTNATMDRAMLLHEMAHIRRGDHWIAWLELFANVLWWWNPFYHWAHRGLQFAAELACDQWVVERLPQKRREFAETLIALCRKDRPQLAPGLLGSSRMSPSHFRRRLTMIMTSRYSTARLRWGWTLALALALVAGPSWQMTMRTEAASPEAPAEVPSEPVDKETGPGAELPAAGTSDNETPARRVRIDEHPGALETSKSGDANHPSSVLAEVMQQLESNYFEPFDEQQLTREALSNILKQLNPETELFDARQLTEVQHQVNGSMVGIGAALKARGEGGKQVIVVERVLPDSPAERAGLQADDLIQAIDGQAVESVAGGLPAIVDKIRGKEGTTVKLRVARAGQATPLELDVQRASVRLTTVQGYSHGNDAQSYYCNAEQKIGYIQIVNFAHSTPEEFRAAVSKLQKAGLRALVVDLRFNGGGLLEAVTDVADLLLDQGKIVTIMPRDASATKTYEATAPAEGELSLPGEVPVTVLVNSSTASAAEVLAACLQDNGRAKIVGQRTRGIGLVKGIVPLSDGSALKLPIAAMVRPNGNRLQRAPQATEADRWGVQPDADGVVVMTRADEEQLMVEFAHRGQRNHRPQQPDAQLQRALELLPKS